MGVQTNLSVVLSDDSDHVTAEMRINPDDDLVVSVSSSSGPVFASLDDVDAFADALKGLVAHQRAAAGGES